MPLKSHQKSTDKKIGTSHDVCSTRIFYMTSKIKRSLRDWSWSVNSRWRRGIGSHQLHATGIFPSELFTSSKSKPTILERWKKKMKPHLHFNPQADVCKLQLHAQHTLSPNLQSKTHSKPNPKRSSAPNIRHKNWWEALNTEMPV